MDQQVIEGKMLILAVFISILLLSFFSLKNYFFDQSSLVICKNKTYLTIYVNLARDEQTIIYSNNAKEALSCLGKKMVFYDRKIERISSQIPYNVQKEIEKRYTVGPKFNTDIKIGAYEISGKKIYTEVNRKSEYTNPEEGISILSI